MNLNLNLKWIPSPIELFFLLFAVTFAIPASAQDYKLVWSEEFDGEEIDHDTWVPWVGKAYNNELQYYTGRDKNVFIKDGHLHLQAWRESYNGAEFTSARISSDSTRIGWEQGRFEARIKMPRGKGFWPAFWLMPIREIGWPRGGEIDIMEFRGNEPSITTGAIHFWMKGCSGHAMECRKYYTDKMDTKTDLTEEFNIYALEWTEDELIWFWNDQEYFRMPFSDIEAEFDPFTGPFYIILNLAVGGDFLPNPDETTPFPQSLVVDYVRVYQKSD